MRTCAVPSGVATPNSPNLFIQQCPVQPPVNHPHGGPPWLLLLLLHTLPPLRAYIHRLPPPLLACRPLNLLCCLRFIINPSFCSALFLFLSFSQRRPTPRHERFILGPARDRRAGILNSKYLSRRRGAGRHSDKQVERVQARIWAD